jgi:16S rRNA (cytidine1402-2'-O)-methyltransferase
MTSVGGPGPGRADEPGGGLLFVVATPIGNLGDITLRAIDVLREVPLIAAEDTRHTRILLERHGLKTRLASYHAHSSPARTTALLAHLRSGADLAIVTDAGTPSISDPGQALIEVWAAEGGRIVPIPGASAVLAALAASGLAGPRWSFEGFLPRKGRDRRKRLAAIAADERGSVIFEAPDRIRATLLDLAVVCGSDRPAAICRELTKLHESIERGTLGALGEMLSSGRIPTRGEFVIVLGTIDAVEAAPDDEQAALKEARRAVERLVADGTARGAAAREVAASTGLPRRRLYGSVENPTEREP